MHSKIIAKLLEQVELVDEYLHENNRLKTYKLWPFKQHSPCSAQKMAEAGFIFVGSRQDPDSVKCFYCHKSLDGWEEGDNPWSEHLKHAPYCEFAKMQKAQASWTLAELIDFFETFEVYSMNQHINRLKKGMAKCWEMKHGKVIKEEK
ncbi:baculoviral IAP repeat-containing protein 5-like [Euwallacea similis]|uniref:baculoviral IAP repeat-containing protein 5-like n=1 Tax=Euwallacea similis TaxID=1736056 RepID=UPI00344C9D8A